MPDLIVRRISDDSEVNRFPITHPTERKVERVVSGMLINMDSRAFYVDDSEFDYLQTGQK